MEQHPSTHQPAVEHESTDSMKASITDAPHELELESPQRRNEHTTGSIDLFLSVPTGLEDVAVRTLPSLLIDAAAKVSYRVGSGYLLITLGRTSGAGHLLQEAISNLVQHPPLCIFAAYVSIGVIAIPREVFEAPKDLLVYVLNGFRSSQEQEQEAAKPDGAADQGLRWQDGLSVLKSGPSPLSDRLTTTQAQHGTEHAPEPIRFRASFDRGDVQHKGVRSQDLAAGLGTVTARVFPSWTVDLKEYEVEVMGRWLQEESDEIVFKSDVSTDQGNGSCRISMASATDRDHMDESHKRARIDDNISTAYSKDSVKMEVGMTLPLALAACPYRYRPMDGRTSLKIEIAYTVLAMAGPKPGDIVLDFCSGVGTIPIVGAAQFPEAMFAGFEILNFNVDKAAENSRAMVEKVGQERAASASGVSAGVPGPCLFMGDARAVCWRSSTVDLIVSDLPWGQRENSHLYNCKLYPRIVREIIRLLKPNGRAILVTGERKLLQRQLDAPFAKPHLTLLQKREITIGFKVMVFELLRT